MAGSIYLQNDKGERRATGSYYTPDHIVDHIVQSTLGPICKQIQDDIQRQLEDCNSLRAAAKGEEAKKLDLRRRPCSEGRGNVKPMNDVSHILSAIEQGDPRAAEELLPLVYDELRKLAAQKLAREKPGQTLQATALAHEAYLRLVGADPDRTRAHGIDGPMEDLRR